MSPWHIATERNIVRKLIASSSNNVSNRQHHTPCSDCPWRRDSLPGWLGDYEPKEFIWLGHNDEVYNCHVIVNQQCAGLAVYRANVCKRVDPPNLKLPKDKAKVFGFHTEFLAHHERRKP